MASQINASNSGFGGIVSTGDSSGVLELQTTGTTALTIDTSQRVGFVAGTAAAPAITRTGDTNTGMFFPAADTIAFTEGGTEAMRLDSSGNVGIGTASPTSFGANTHGITLDGTGNYQHITWKANGTIVADAFTNGTAGFFFGTETSSPLQFQTAGAERMRIDSSGNVLVGTTSNASSAAKIMVSSTAPQMAVDGNGAGVNSLINWTTSGTTKAQTYFDATNTRFYIACNNAGGVYLASGGTSWTSASDERVKDIIEPIENATEKLGGWRAVIGKYKTDADGTRRSFLIAQDVIQTFPEAVDATNEEELGVSYTDIIPVLVAAIQEQQTIINDLKARIETLEAK